MSIKRVLLADDSPLFTSALAELIESTADLCVAGVARDGAEAVRMTERLEPDLVVMDVLMPVMDGLSAVEKIMAARPTPVLVITADPRSRTGALSMEALARGALDLVAKPQSFPVAHEEAAGLIERMRLLASVSVLRHVRGRRHTWRRPQVERPTPEPAGGRRGVILVGMVASTGGPNALAQLLSKLPADLGATLVIVQHIHDGFTEALCSWLARNSALPVRQAADGDGLSPSTVLVAPPGRHLLVTAGGRLRLESPSTPASYCPSGDVLLSSMARYKPAQSCGVVLTGMGVDGADGLLALRRAGGVTVAQDAASCVVDGMPRAARERGAPRLVLSLGELPSALIRLCREGGPLEDP